MSGLSDNDLIIGLLNNDRKSIEQIYKDNFGQIRAYVMNNNGDLDEAKDIFQEALILLFEKAKNGDFKLSSKLGTYLYSLSRNIWLKKLTRSRGKEISTSEFTQDDSFDRQSEESLEERDLQFSIMEDAMNKLGEPCKALLESFYVQKMDMKSITEVFGYTNADNAKTQKYKCLMRLKKLFFDKYSN
ncbi:MAG: RNA polymerase subunit sigma-70 [Pseudopedobacter saltans]|uniref:RNA polymerase subunit sigma-70 n=1 Tax=Pseudopedobacter saltans TaxID=151895 RepID=A0A2W5GTA7_9SPHI|nr:MAG: RNA polymerase subunit sigma-70 [Pseudopedobacter saltans]